jgi:hypothetical protein
MAVRPFAEAPLARLIRHPALRRLVLATGIGVSLSALGVFDVEGRPFLARTWPIVAILLFAMGAGHLIRSFTARLAWTSSRPLLHAVLVGALLSPLVTLATWTLEAAITGFWWLPDLFAIFPAILGACPFLSLAFSSFHRIASSVRKPVAFLDRLPMRLRSAELWAVEAEDHYLRVHTSKGSDLILMRFSDALRELRSVEGEHVHRSWWVAKGAVADTAMEGRRGILTLKDGSAAPVSRARVAELRSKGWF